MKDKTIIERAGVKLSKEMEKEVMEFEIPFGYIISLSNNPGIIPENVIYGFKPSEMLGAFYQPEKLKHC